MTTHDTDGQSAEGFFPRVARWWQTGSKLRRAGIALLLLAILTTLFLLVGSHGSEGAWEKYRRELEAKGEKLDWEAFIPPAVPDEENFFKAPGMTAWFSKYAWQSNKVTIFELPPWISDRPITLAQLRAMPEQTNAKGEANFPNGSREQLRVWFAQLTNEYHLLVEASARPFVRFDADYRDPMKMDYPNFLNERRVAQALATQASLNVLDGRPDEAVRDLFIMWRLADLSGSSPTVVGRMVRVAILALYVQRAREALDSGSFSDAQLKAVQEQLLDVNVLKAFAQTVRAERAIEVRLWSLPPAELTKVLQQINAIQSGPARPFWQFDWQHWFADLRLELNLRSRSWLAANVAFLCRAHQDALDQMDASGLRINATGFSLVFSNFQQTLAGSPSYGQLAAISMPNYSRAALTVARNQTQLDQLRVACALERYRLKHRAYPETLEALTPEFLDRIPNDLFADQPLQYRRNDPGAFRLWSIGWNEKDDGGATFFDKNGKPSYDENQGDWVWDSSEK